MKTYKSLLIIWAVALVVGAGCILYVNWSFGAIRKENARNMDGSMYYDTKVNAVEINIDGVWTIVK